MNSDAELPLDQAEMIFEKPASSEFTEISFGSDQGNTLWIRFSDRYGITEWIGKFGCGFRTVMRVTKAAEPDHFMIVAGGFAYLVEATKRVLLNHHCDDFVEDIVYDSCTGRFIAADTHLRMIEAGREVWKSRRIALDGICDLQIKDRLLTGQAVTGYQGETEPFVFDLDTNEFVKSPAWQF